MEERLEIVEERLDRIEQKLDSILGILSNSNIQQNCEKMGKHIDFVEDVYTNVKHPLDFIVRRVKNLPGFREEPLPLLTLPNNTPDQSSDQT